MKTICTLEIACKLAARSSMVRQPRMPCYKLAAKFRRDDILAALSAQRPQRVLLLGGARRGRCRPGTHFELLSHEQEGISIAEMNRLFVSEKYNRELLDKAIATAALPEDWRNYFSQRLPGASPVEQ